MKTYDETFNSVISKRDAYVKKKQHRNKTVKKVSGVCVCVFAAVLTAAVLINHFEIDLNPVSMGEPEMGDYSGTPAFGSPTEESVTEPAFETHIIESDSCYAGEQTTAPPVGHTAVPDGGIVEQYSSGYSPENDFSNPNCAAPSSSQPGETRNWTRVEKAITGEPLSDEEAAIYFSENMQSLISSLSSSGVETDNIVISEKGYCHVNVSASDPLEIKVNFRDYLVYNGSSLVAIVTLYKENGEIFSTPSFGAPWFSTYNDFLQAHKGQNLVYIYCGMGEYIITIENQIFSPLGIEIMPEFCTDYFDYYSVFNEGWNVYVP
ncbi:MAG: hypothetical protein J1E34_01990 [Oscillospiraceae bacterium]|nr:hypothetical protein [Oscillospiraceae bacterium]